MHRAFAVLAVVALGVSAPVAAPQEIRADTYYLRCAALDPSLPRYYMIKIGEVGERDGRGNPTIEFWAEQRTSADDPSKWTGKFGPNLCTNGFYCALDYELLKRRQLGGNYDVVDMVQMQRGYMIMRTPPPGQWNSCDSLSKDDLIKSHRLYEKLKDQLGALVLPQ